ncbi:ferritin-like domain-containing protein [Marivita sp. S6314]|uniref:YciE/YciF ferroxidase family protein n=1 Tax=Marivita sp. S6314 TaxID=2926406 RepID=UPI001FF1065F|nr:ferritin-like domain-containing protein [Marivita sp. S6314]MCK0150064.1 ferritin-like domain-containing protein [Marivita sp. S6314]
MPMNSLKDVYIDQLQDIYSACKQSLTATKELAGAAHNADLKDALEAGVSGIQDGMDTLETILRSHDADPNGEHCKGMEGLVNEARAHGIEEEFGDDAAQDAMIITQYQRMAHYAIAGYGCCKAFAKRLGQGDDVKKLDQCLDKSYDGDRRFTDLAEDRINKQAA